MIKYFSEFCINLYKWLRPSNSKGTRPVCIAVQYSTVHYCYYNLVTPRRLTPSLMSRATVLGSSAGLLVTGVKMSSSWSSSSPSTRVEILQDVYIVYV